MRRRQAARPRSTRFGRSATTSASGFPGLPRGARLCRSAPDAEGFFPCPKPAFGTLRPNSLIPIPDYVYYQDQAEEIDDLTDRIANLLDSLKLVGFYPAGPSTEGAEAIEIA
jgi:hypothetical protein